VIVVTHAPAPGSVFAPTTMNGVTERFVSLSMRVDVPPCEYVETEIDGLVVIVEDLGVDDLGAVRRECSVRAGGVSSDFPSVEQDGSAADGSVFGSRMVSDRTIGRIRRWAATHGMPDLGPARTPHAA
jgi:hypothetical protein